MEMSKKPTQETKLKRPGVIIPMLIVGLLTLIAACSGGGSSPAPTPAPPDAGATAIPTPTPAAGPVAEPILVPLSDALFLTVTVPEDESVVSSELVTVSGKTAPDAVVSVNGVIVEVDPLGEFSASALLLEGPNTIEVVASDLTVQERVDIAVIYLPQ